MSQIRTRIQSALLTNIKPGIFLWLVLVLFFFSYSHSPLFQEKLEMVGQIKSTMGFGFSFLSYAFFGGFMPELLKIVLIEQKCTKKNIRNILFGVILWGLVGIYTDLTFKIQQAVFGQETDILTLCKKTSADQLFYSPFAAFIITSAIFLHENHLPVKSIHQFFAKDYITSHIIPVIIALWLVWVPGMIVVYSMPSNLQLPVATCILCFWSLIITFMAKHNEV